MKHFLAILVLGALLAACGTPKAAGLKAERKASQLQRNVENIERALRDSDYVIAFDYVHPRTMEPRFLTSYYRIHVMGDSIDSNLPYYGRAYRINFDYESPLDFVGPITKPVVVYKDSTTLNIRFNARHRDEILEYDMNVHNDASVELHVTSAERDYCDFTGSFEFQRKSQP